MPSSGTSTYVDPDEYQAMFREGRVDLVLANAVGFKARQTWVKLDHLCLLRNEESLPRVAYVSFPPELVFVGLPGNSGSLPTWGGIKLKSGEIVLHGRGERTHYRTDATSRWGFVSLMPEHLAGYCRAIAGFDLALPSAGRICGQPGARRPNWSACTRKPAIWRKPSPK